MARSLFHSRGDNGAATTGRWGGTIFGLTALLLFSISQAAGAQGDRVDDSEKWNEIARERAQWWCWQPLRVDDRAAHGAPAIDQWIDRGIQAAGIVSAGQADRRTLIRRLSFQLSGLPPAYEEVEEFIRDSSPEAWEHCVDRFLAKPEFGVHWARHWMDVVRYAETHGSEDDAVLPFSYRYRDYLIRALQNDVPFDQLIREHLAGDLIPPRWNRELGINEALIGTGFLRFVEFNQTPVDVKREEIVVIDAQIDAIGKAFQAITISCARCHDHKFDPISDEDFYALYGILRSTRSGLRVIDDPAIFDRDRAELVALQGRMREAIAPAWIEQISRWPAELERARLWCQEHWKPEAKWDDLKRQVAQKQETEPVWTHALAEALCRPKVATLAPLAKLLTTDDAQFAAAANRVRREVSDRRRLAATWPDKTELLFDLTDGELHGWRPAGAGLAEQPLAQPGSWAIEGGRAQPFAGLLERGFHSNLVSDRHGGSLRSPDFVLDMEEISLLVRGTGNARARLVIENFQGDSLLFEPVNRTLDSASLRWITMTLRQQWRGLRAHIELLTRDDKPYIGVTKDPGVLEQSDGRSSFGIAKVVKHARGVRLTDPPWLLEDVVHTDTGEVDLAESGREQWINAVCQASRNSIERFARGAATDDDARWITTLMDARVLRCELPADATFSQRMQSYRKLEGSIPIARRVPGVYEDLCAVNQPLLRRGDHRKPGEEVPRRYLAILGSKSGAYAGPASGRRRLAEEIASPHNPLTARVYVNRVSHWLFGRGIVASVDNFGQMGEPPSHPELLDQLAAEFMRDGWSTKRLIRRIVLTRAWQRSSLPTESAMEHDPANRWWSHAGVRRLDAESIRDSMLSVAGNIKKNDSGLGTPGFYRSVQEPNKQSPPGPLDGAGRRSIFLEVRRNFPNEFLLAFDFPRPAASGGRRPLATVPGQSLTLMNDPFVVHQSWIWAKRVLAAEPTTDGRLRMIYRDLLNRDPTADEAARAGALVAATKSRGEEQAGWELLTHAMFNLKEAIYLP
ncbi:MAG TPA: DUF1553 domain-containing protein [Planctomycetaceae bacterium]|jgi:hypothetical protein